MDLINTLTEKRTSQPVGDETPKEETWIDKLRKIIKVAGPIESHNRQIEKMQEEAFK